MTFSGTNTYLLGQRDIAVIDPGPNLDMHLEAILSALQPGQRVTHIAVTHSHLDHSALAVRLAEEVGAPTYGFGPWDAGRSALMTEMLEAGLDLGGGEGVDKCFIPNIRLCDRETIQMDGETLVALWTPGHMSNHLSFQWGGRIFTGDLVMGWATSLISPPDGDLAAFLQSCRTLAGLNSDRLYPAHGQPIKNPNARIDWLVEHRRRRHAQILKTLSRDVMSLSEIAREIYHDLPPLMLPVAKRNVFAHLIKMHQDAEIVAAPHLSPQANFTLRQNA
ncbi:MBL fold metallo-hydrolase [Qingshengfaniella alkalisoli]|uniref:MBL fold metallo-hydrolase n=2 Tax=Qingshengfaniella alkalisoli TaxID=2599296 RepID=A0A5B8IX26_9RHOB|nr:MBL fold metallo-hydrolase [Qingshengfaniella alkalisoli]